MRHPTKLKLLESGLVLLLEHGYNALGIQGLLREAGVPRGSFYHHFESKEDFALEVVDLYMERVHEALHACVEDDSRPPLDRVRGFFELTHGQYHQDGYLGCMLGGLGQELSGVNPVFREKIDACLTEIGDTLAGCLEEARRTGDLPADADCAQMSALLVDCWEGAALRSRLRRSPAPLEAMLDFYFGRIGAGVTS
ncbi:MAG: TetR family transcriptional regulator C-terminal domain-containing protein [Gemmatimonadota bacterium]|nr:TetR family transcriptional regulator C-terminal domain-containing protein [Gemmatimonadota bacterium]